MLNELLPHLDSLTRADKLYVIEHLAADLAREEPMFPSHGAECAVWSPYDAVDGGASLLRALELDEEQAR